ncbi:MAG: hypothetical protein ACJAS4_002084 [Bacteriovoracaceae bacterium]|jgi:hypothetical protein
MKFLVLLSALLSSLTVQASCKTYEALVFGDVVQVTKIEETCVIEIDVDQISEHRLCPLARVDIELSKIEDPTCEYKLGDGIDGYIIQTPGNKYLLLDK